MPTRPIQDVLPPEWDEQNPEVATVLRRFSGLIVECVAFGTHVFDWLNRKLEGRGDEVAPVVMSFRHVLELLDGVGALVEKGCVEASKPVLRGALESSLGLTYMLDEETERRSMSFLVCWIHHRLKQYERFDPEHPSGKDFEAQTGLLLQHGYDLKKQSKALRELLKKPKYREAEKEYQRLRGRGTRNPRWYSLFDGPNSMEQLAREVDLFEWYEVLYRQWSAHIHGTDLFVGRLLPGESGAEITSLRNPADAQQITSLSVSFSLYLWKLFIDKYMPERVRDYSAWYLNEVQTDYQAVSSQRKILVVE